MQYIIWLIVFLPKLFTDEFRSDFLPLNLKNNELLN